MKWNTSAKQTETGNIAFHYTQLGELKKDIKPEPVAPLGLSKKTKVISLTKEYNTDIITLFHATGDFNYRSRWQEGVKTVEEVNHFLPRVGTKCRAIMENGQSIIYASSYSYKPDKIEFSETNQTDKSTAYYMLEQTGEKTTKLTLDYYIEKNIVSDISFRLLKQKKMEAAFHKSLENLVELVKEIKLPPATL